MVKLTEEERRELRLLDRKAVNSIMMASFRYKTHRNLAYEENGRHGMFTGPAEIDRYFTLGGTLK